VLDVGQFDFSRVQIVFSAADEAVAAVHAPRAAAAGCVVIDSTAGFRDEPDVPLVVPEVNPHAIARYRARNIIASPGGAAILLAVALKPIHDAVGVVRINVATYQSVSGTGKEAIEELAQQTIALFNQREIEVEVYPKRIAFNLLPQIDGVQANGYTGEEMEMVREIRKILEDEAILVNPTAVRVPVFFGQAQAVHIETRRKVTAGEAREMLDKAPGVAVMDERTPGGYPTPLEATGEDAVFVGRIREDISHPLGLDLWVVSDNMRKGAALNSVQIAEILIEKYL